MLIIYNNSTKQFYCKYCIAAIHVEPNQVTFSTYCIIHEMYAITRLIFFIMTGKTNTGKIKNSTLKNFVSKGLNPNKLERYQNINELIATFREIKDIDK